MTKRLKIGILRETKNPPDRRVPLTPPQITALEEIYPDVEFFVQPSDIRCYSNEEFEYLDIPLREDLRRQASALGLEDNVIFSGQRSDVESILSISNLFVSSSLWEGLPTVIIESMAVGTPVVATDVSGTRELIEDEA